MKRIIIIFLAILAVIVITYFARIDAVAQRGNNAYGGEMLIPVLIIGTVLLTKNIINTIKKYWR